MAYNIEISRHGTWKVYIDNIQYSSHNEEKEGYENMVEVKLNNRESIVELRPEFYASITITGGETIPPIEEKDTTAPAVITLKTITQ